MVTYSVNLDLSKFAVVETTVSSLVAILGSAGLSNDEIASLLRRTADQLVSGAPSHEREPSDWAEPSHQYDAKHKVYDLFERFEQTPEKKALARLSKRASALGYAQDVEELEKAFDILSQALPLVEAAQTWIMNDCTDSGIQFEPSKDEWLESADDEELDGEDEIVFLDDWQVSGDFQFQQIETLARAYAHSGNTEGYRRLVNLLGAHKVLYGKALEEVTKAGDAFEEMAGFLEFLVEHSGHGELAQSSLLDEYIQRTGFSGGTYLLDGWLESLAAEGKIQRYKRSNRWRVIIG